MQNRDVFLIIPCDLTNYIIKPQNNIIGEYLINQILQNNQREFKGDFIKCLERYVIGKYILSSSYMPKDEEAIFTITKHPKTNNGLLLIYISLSQNNPVNILQSLISNILNLKNLNNELIPLNKFLENENIFISGTPKGLIFIDGKLNKEEIINTLACEETPMGKIIGKELVESANTNIAQYNSAEVYCSENVLLELQNHFSLDYQERLANEAIEVFFMELIVLQDAAISRICNKIIKELDIETKNPIRENNTQILDELSCETAQAILFLDFNYFIYPTVRNATEVIAKNFGLDKSIEKYYKYKDALETLINLHSNQVNEMGNKNMNILLLVLTITQIIPIFIELFTIIFYGKITFFSIISFISSLSACFILLLVFNLIRKYRLKKYKQSLIKI